MLLKDLMEIYRIYYVHVQEILERFASLNHTQAKKGFVMYQNFINLTEGIKNKANKLIYMFQFPINLPNFYTPDKGLIDTLRVVVSAAEGSSEGADDAKLNDVTNKLKISMENGHNALQMEIKDED